MPVAKELSYTLGLFGTIRTRAHNNPSMGLRIRETDCQSNSNVIIVRGGTLNLRNSVGFSKKNDRLTFCMLLTRGGQMLQLWGTLKNWQNV